MITSVDPWNVEGYLRRLKVDHTGRPSSDALRTLHRAHVERVPYETLGIQLGQVTSVDPAQAAARIIGGRGGYCFHLNGAFALLLTALGYDVLLHVGGVTDRQDPSPAGASGNHLALSVHGLPDARSPDGAWLIDVGLGDALHEPVPLRSGTYRQGPFTYQLSPSEVVTGGWRFEHDPAGCFARMDFDSGPATPGDFDRMHEWLSTNQDSPFLRTVTVQRRTARTIQILRGCALTTVSSLGTSREVFDTEGSWFELLSDIFGLTLADLSHEERSTLWKRVSNRHEEWIAEIGRDRAEEFVPAHARDMPEHSDRS